MDVGGARALADQDRYQFQYWAMSLLEALPRDQGRKGADRGIDGVVYFLDGPKRTTQKAIVQVKSGRVSSPHIRDLKGTLERESAVLGLFITLEEPTRDMLVEAASAGFYHSDVWQRDYPGCRFSPWKSCWRAWSSRSLAIPPCTRRRGGSARCGRAAEAHGATCRLHPRARRALISACTARMP